VKRRNVKYGKKLKQRSDEAFNAGKESEAMKRLTLHRIASSLQRFIASSLHCFIGFSAQLWLSPKPTVIDMLWRKIPTKEGV
jgi:hypothetical protein